MSNSSQENSEGFHLLVSGQIEGCEILGGDNLYCQYSITHGVDWTRVHGIDTALSQTARRPSGSSGDEQQFVWNFPIDVTYKSSNVFGWPQIVISVFGYTFFGNEIVRGYGSMHIPTTPGRHVRYVRLYTPVSSSWCQRVTSWLTSNPPEYFHSSFVAQGSGRYVTRVRSNGVVKLVLNVSTRNMNTWGYVTHTERETVSLSDKTSKPAASSLLPNSSTTAQTISRSWAGGEEKESKSGVGGVSGGISGVSSSFAGTSTGGIGAGIGSGGGSGGGGRTLPGIPFARDGPHRRLVPSSDEKMS